MSVMRAQVLETAGSPLVSRQRPVPVPGPGQVLIEVAACGVCRTDLHLRDAELPAIPYPVIPGHEIVGRIRSCGPGVHDFEAGARVGVAWLGSSCGQCEACQAGSENLCSRARFTGYQIDGGYATETVADARYVFRLPDGYSDAEAAPLLCAGLIGFRCLGFCGPARRLGLYGFGAAAHLVIQLARFEERTVFAFTRPGDRAGQEFARSLGAAWAGGSDESPPTPLDAAILFAPVGSLVPRALAAVRPGGIVVLGGIHMSDLPGFPYALIWGERRLQSVAHLTRADARAFLARAPQVPIRTQVQTYPLEGANQALEDLRTGRIRGAAVLVMSRADTGGTKPVS
jgi:propanol-preferring alcohol dehydrogenase